MKIFGIQVGTHSHREKTESKKDKVSEVAHSTLKESSKTSYSPLSLGSRFASWIKNEFWTFIDSFYSPKQIMLKPQIDNVISKELVNPIKMPIQDFELEEVAAYKISDDVYKKIKIAGLKADTDNPNNDVVFSAEGEKIPMSALFKINKWDQTALATKRAGKIALLKEVGNRAVNSRDVNIGDFLIQTDKNNLIVEVVEIKNNNLTVFDGRNNVLVPISEFHHFRSEKDALLDKTLDASEVNFFKEEVNIGELIALRYKQTSIEPDREDQTIPIQYREKGEKFAGAPIYKLVKVVEIYPDIIVFNGITHFAVDPSDIFGINIDMHKVGDAISKNYLDEKELNLDEIPLNGKMAIKANGSYKVVEIKNKTFDYVLVDDGAFTRWVPISTLKKIR